MEGSFWDGAVLQTSSNNTAMGELLCHAFQKHLAPEPTTKHEQALISLVSWVYPHQDREAGIYFYFLTYFTF